MNSPVGRSFFNNHQTRKFVAASSSQKYVKQPTYLEIDTPVPHLLPQLEPVKKYDSSDKPSFLTSLSQRANLLHNEDTNSRVTSKRAAEQITSAAPASGKQFYSQNDMDHLLLPSNKKKKFSPSGCLTSQSQPSETTLSEGFKPFEMLKNILLKPLSLTLTPSENKSEAGNNPFVANDTFNLSQFSNFLAPRCEPLIETPKIPFFALLPELSSGDLGGKIIFSTDDFYGTAASILKSSEPCYKKNEVTAVGRWVDGWETQRRRQPVHDWCIIELAFPGEIYGCEVDTTYFEGNQAPFVSVEAAYYPDLSNKIMECYENAKVPPYKPGDIGTTESPEMIEQINLLLQKQSVQHSSQWRDIVSMSPLLPGKRNINVATQHYFPAIESPLKYVTHLRLNLFPDGGIARFRAFGVAVPKSIPPESPQLLSNLSSGGVVICCSNKEFCSNPQVLLKDTVPSCVSDCWETTRQKDRAPCIEVKKNSLDKNSAVTGEQWVVFRLSARCIITKIEVDTNFCYGNCPEFLSIRGVDVTQGCLPCFEDVVAQHELFSNTQLELFPSSATSNSLSVPSEQKKKIKLQWKTIVWNSPVKAGANHVFQPTTRSPSETTPITRKRRGTSRRKGTTPTRRLKEAVAVTPSSNEEDSMALENEQQQQREQYKSLENTVFPTTHLCVTVIPDGALSRIRIWGKPLESQNVSSFSNHLTDSATHFHKNLQAKNTMHTMSNHLEEENKTTQQEYTTPSSPPA